jgi:hypothetical protein
LLCSQWQLCEQPEQPPQHPPFLWVFHILRPASAINKTKTKQTIKVAMWQHPFCHNGNTE